MKLKETLLKNLRPLTYREVEKLREMGFGRKDLDDQAGEAMILYTLECCLDGDDNWKDLPFKDHMEFYEKALKKTFASEDDLKNSKRSGSGTKARVRNTAGPAARRKKT